LPEQRKTLPKKPRHQAQAPKDVADATPQTAAYSKAENWTVVKSRQLTKKRANPQVKPNKR